jgi:phospholipid transport system transporter-binding protein
MSQVSLSQASVNAGLAGEIKLAGVLDYRTGPALRKQGAELIKSSDAPALVIDCSDVEKSSSVGLALLLGFIRDGAAAGKTVSVRALPEDMREIAQVSELTELLHHH